MLQQHSKNMEENDSMERKKNVGVILAAGQGKRFQSNLPKQFVLLNNKPIICYSLETFNNHPLIDEIILVVDEEYIPYTKDLISSYNFKKISHVIPGGKERYESVNSALSVITKNENVLLHDSARPLVNEKQISDVINELNQYSAVTIAIPAIDTTAIVNDKQIITSIPKRSSIWNIQTPQGFHSSLLIESYQKALCDNTISSFTDECGLIQYYNNTIEIKIVLGNQTLKKITYPSDIHLLEIFTK